MEKKYLKTFKPKPYTPIMSEKYTAGSLSTYYSWGYYGLGMEDYNYDWVVDGDYNEVRYYKYGNETCILGITNNVEVARKLVLNHWKEIGYKHCR
jgi:lipoate-protein ligase A